MLYNKYFLRYDFLKIYLQKIRIIIFFLFQEGSIRECIQACLSMQIQENMFMSIAAHLCSSSLFSSIFLTELKWDMSINVLIHV